jgi:hypothetical protein
MNDDTKNKNTSLLKKLIKSCTEEKSEDELLSELGE